jgi:hypothetical protein
MDIRSFFTHNQKKTNSDKPKKTKSDKPKKTKSDKPKKTKSGKPKKIKPVQRNNEPIDWLLLGGDARNLFDSSVYNTWGVESHTSDNKFFLNNVRPNDYLWFVKGGNCGGLIVAVAIFERSVKRVDGECIPYEQLGWTNTTGSWDTDIHYKNFKKIADLNLLSQIKSPKVTRKYNQKCLVNLPEMRSTVYPPQDEEPFDEKESLERILGACLKSIDEMNVLNLLLNSRLANL